jgi:hypothetical protein
MARDHDQYRRAVASLAKRTAAMSAARRERRMRLVALVSHGAATMAPMLDTLDERTATLAQDMDAHVGDLTALRT